MMNPQPPAVACGQPGPANIPQQGYPQAPVVAYGQPYPQQGYPQAPVVACGQPGPANIPQQGYPQAPVPYYPYPGYPPQGAYAHPQQGGHPQGWPVPAGQAPPMQPGRVQVMPSQVLRTSMMMQCPCGYYGPSRILHKPGLVTFGAACCCLAVFWPCSWLPFVVEDCQDVEHHCSSCGRIMATKAPL